MRSISTALRLGGALAAALALLAPASASAQRTPATLSTNRIVFRRPMAVNVCLAAAQASLTEHGWGNVNVNNNQTAMASRANVVVHVICTPSAAFIGAAGSGVSPEAFVDELKDALQTALGQ